MSTRFRAAAVLSGLLLAVLGLASPAAADTVTYKDAKKDVYYCVDDGDDCTLKSKIVDGDMGTTKITHGSKNLAVKTHFVGLGKPDKQGVWGFAITTNEDRKYQLVVIIDKKGKQTTYVINEKKHTPIDCDGRKTSVDLGDNVVSVRIPRKCLSSPSKLKVGVPYYKREVSSSKYYLDITSVNDNWIKHD